MANPVVLTPITLQAVYDGAAQNNNWATVENSFTDLGPYVISGLVPSIGTGLAAAVTAGRALIGADIVVAAGFNIAGLAPSTTNYLYLLQNGTGTSNTTGTQPAASVLLGTALTGVATVTSVNTLRSGGRQLFVRPDALVPGAVGSPGSINLAGWAAAAADNVSVFGTLPSGAVGLAANVALTDRDPQTFTGQNLFTRTALASANSGTVSVGAGGFAGGGGTNFVGSAQGTQIAVNTAAGFSGNLLHAQLAGDDRFFVAASGVALLQFPDASPTLIRYPLTLRHTVSTAATGGSVGIGTGITFDVESATDGVFENAGAVAAQTTAITSGAVSANVLIQARDAGTLNTPATFTGQNGGRLGIATTVPTARLHLPAGSATASTGPLKLSTGTLLSTPEAGSVEFLTPTFSFTPVTNRRTLPGSSDAITAPVTVTTTTETVLATGHIAGGELAAGRVVKLRIIGRYTTTNGTDTFTIRFKNNGTGGVALGGLTAVSTGATVTNAPFDLTFIMTCRTTGGAGQSACDVSGTINSVDKTAHATATQTFDTTATENITPTVTWNAVAGGPTFICEQAWMELL